jgi:membrane protease YdiL (CAAX protease family)
VGGPSGPAPPPCAYDNVSPGRSATTSMSRPSFFSVQYSWYGMLSILVFGLILGVIRRRSSTTAAILVHALHNLIAVAVAKP